MRFGLTVLGILCIAGTLTFGQSRPDLYSLERQIQDAQSAMAQAGTNAGAERELRDLEDEVAYLRVKTRKGETVTDREKLDLSNRIDRFTDRLTNRNGSRSSDRNRVYDQGRGQRGNSRLDRTIPASTELDVRLQTPLSSKTAVVEDRVEATTVVDLYQGDELLVPAGSLLVGNITSVDRASRTDRKGSLTVEFTRLTVNGRTSNVRATVVDAIESEGLKGEIGKIGAGAGVGAIIGGIIGGVKGAITGILIGAGGVLVATEGKDVDLPSGSVLRVRFDDAVLLTDY
jgi:hypothetical protein